MPWPHVAVLVPCTTVSMLRPHFTAAVPCAGLCMPWPHPRPQRRPGSAPVPCAAAAMPRPHFTAVAPCAAVSILWPASSTNQWPQFPLCRTPSHSAPPRHTLPRPVTLCPIPSHSAPPRHTLPHPCFPWGVVEEAGCIEEVGVVEEAGCIEEVGVVEEAGCIEEVGVVEEMGCIEEVGVVEEVWLYSDEARKVAVIAFRGTEQVKWKDLATDLNLVPTSLNAERIDDDKGASLVERLVKSAFETADKLKVRVGGSMSHTHGLRAHSS
eukprot:357945-Chlamydomonas_euryale.AAC.1